jgi:hypothetical protein
MIYPEEGLKNPERWSEQCEEWEVASRRMSQKQVWRGQIGALDGCIIGMDSIGDMDYHCERKKKFAILLMAIVNANGLFVWWDMSHG